MLSISIAMADARITDMLVPNATNTAIIRAKIREGRECLMPIRMNKKASGASGIASRACDHFARHGARPAALTLHDHEIRLYRAQRRDRQGASQVGGKVTKISHFSIQSGRKVLTIRHPE